MKTIEYKHVRHEWSLGTQFSTEKFNDQLMEMLTEQGGQGWDLKGIIPHQNGLHAHFIFGRESVGAA